MFSVIIPAYNEENAIREVVNRVKLIPLEKEIIVVDDGSSDRTYEVARGIPGIKLLRHEVNKGKAAALNTGYEAAKGDIFVNIDADCTYPPEIIPQLIAPIENGEADMILASRFIGKIKAMKTLNRLGNVFFSWLVTLLTGKKITDASTGMRAFSKELWDAINVEAKGLEWEVEMTTRAIRKGFRVLEVPIIYSDRVGASKLKPIKDGFGFFKAIIKAKFF